MAILLLATVALLPSVLGHGQVRTFISSYGTWTAADAYAAANASSPIRYFSWEGQ